MKDVPQFRRRLGVADFFRSQRTTFLQFATHRIFPDNIAHRNEQNSNKTIKPADETEVIADVIIRESEIAAMD